MLLLSNLVKMRMRSKYYNTALYTPADEINPHMI